MSYMNGCTPVQRLLGNLYHIYASTCTSSSSSSSSCSSSQRVRRGPPHTHTHTHPRTHPRVVMRRLWAEARAPVNRLEDPACISSPGLEAARHQPPDPQRRTGRRRGGPEAEQQVGPNSSAV